ncbi:uncharacterized protein LOC123542778 [Mercenaria mercenaria]|uniref:uncharacterized protein LOC123542778 n=1 Tax=Mercenaria mercenaria TaxID=6596 RepID=UPI00234E5DFA|nr:uncharacterized protein LOC123542778 [Mercenaria mercenaria]
MVANQRILSNVTRQYEHPMFDPASTVYIDSSPSDKSDPCDTDGIPAALHTILLKHALLCRQQYKVKPIPEQVRQKAETIFTTNYTLAIVGPPQSGKTSIAFHLLSTYDLSEGEKNFLLLTDPGQVSYVDFDKKPVLIIKMGYPGFDKLEACHWYKKFDLLFAAVKDNKTAVIFTMDIETYKIWSDDMPIHPILNHDFVVRVGKSSLEKIEGAGYSTKQCSVSKQDGLITVLKMAGNSMNHSENAWKEYPLGNFNEDEGNFNEDKGDLYFMATSTDKKLRKQIHKQDLKRKARHPLKRDEDEVFEKEKKNRVYQKQL